MTFNELKSCKYFDSSGYSTDNRMRLYPKPGFVIINGDKIINKIVHIKGSKNYYIYFLHNDFNLISNEANTEFKVFELKEVDTL